MKLREWILTGTATGGNENQPTRVLTAPDAPRSVADAKMHKIIPEKYWFCVGIKKGKIVKL